MNEDTKQRFEILKMAREMLNEEYTFKRATDHNRWLVESHEEWTKHQRAIPHPAFAPYPTEREVLDAATVLYNFVYNQETKAPVVEHVEVPRAVIHKPIPEGDFVFPKKVEKIKEIVEEPIEEIAEETEIVEEPARTDVLSQQTIKGLLPGWIRRSSK